MTKDGYNLAVAAVNGHPQRLVSISRPDGKEFRDSINVDSAVARGGFIRRAAGKFDVDREALEWLDDAMVSEADEANARADAAVGEGNREERKSQATQLVELAGGSELFYDADGEAYARFAVDEHFEMAGVRTKSFRRWLTRLFFAATGKAPSSQALQDAIGVVEGKALFEGKMRTVHIRLAEHRGNIYVDLCNAAWQVVEITATGWRVLDRSPVAFRRAKAMLPLPIPLASGSVAELRRFVHMTDGDWTLFVAWLVAALRPKGPYPVLDIQGEHGSGKSTVCRMARALIDPNTAMIRSEPREPRDLMIASKNGWIIAFDNLSGIHAWQSDCLCRLATGGGFSTRTLYENDEETIFDAQRPSMINGIEEVATRADLLDRCLLLNLPRIEQDQRRPESELWSQFDEARPRILGGLFSAVACALKNIDSTVLPTLPRMADFALWATAAGPALGYTPSQFTCAYRANREAGNEVALEASPVGKVIVDFVAEVSQWSGTSTELLRELERRVDDATKRLKIWPATARPLGGAVKRLAPNLREAGIDVDFHRKGKGSARMIVFKLRTEQVGDFASVASASSAMQRSSDSAHVAADANSTAGANCDGFASALPSASSEEYVAADANDIADANLQDCSEWHDDHGEPESEQLRGVGTSG